MFNDTREMSALNMKQLLTQADNIATMTEKRKHSHKLVSQINNKIKDYELTMNIKNKKVMR